jgi:hypothetical protein
MELSQAKLEEELLSLLITMDSGAVLCYSTKGSGLYRLCAVDGTETKIRRVVGRAAWDRGYLQFDKHKNGITIYRLSSLGWVRCKQQIGHTAAST